MYVFLYCTLQNDIDVIFLFVYLFVQPTWLRLQNVPTASVPEYPYQRVTKQSDGETLEMLDPWRMRSALSLQSLTGPLWPKLIAPDSVLSVGQIVFFGT